MSDQDETRLGQDGEPPAGPGGPEGPEPTGGPEGPEPTGGPDDALRSLERLEGLTRGERSAPPPPASASLRRKLPRLAAVPRSTQGWARIAAPVALLVAVIVVVSVAFQSGVVGDDGTKAVKPAAKVTHITTKSPKPGSSAKATSTASAKPTTTPSGTGDTKTYKIKPGDTLSGIAARFDTSVSEIEALNADVDLTTLQPGEKLIVPAQ